MCTNLQHFAERSRSEFRITGISVMGNNDIMIGAKRTAAALKGPVGQIKLARVVDQHLRWFADDRSQGMTWDQTIAALTAAGATRADGTPFRRGPASSAVWRAERATSRAQATGPASATASAPGRSNASVRKSPRRVRKGNSRTAIGVRTDVRSSRATAVRRQRSRRLDKPTLEYRIRSSAR